MGTHPIFESDFDCLTEPKFRMTGIPGSANTPSKYPEREYNTRFRRRQTSEFERYEKVTRNTKIIEPKSIDEIKPKIHFLAKLWSFVKWTTISFIAVLALNGVFITAYLKYHGVQVNVFMERVQAATVEPRTIFDKLDFTWISQFFEQLMARVDELRDQYEIDLEQIGEAWLRMQKQAGAWFDEMKNKLT